MSTDRYPWVGNTTPNTADQDDPRYETPGGAQTKADLSLEDAKKYTDDSLLTYQALTVNLADDSVTRPKIAPGAVGSTELDPSLLDYTTDIAIAAKFNQIDDQLNQIDAQFSDISESNNTLIRATSNIIQSLVAQTYTKIAFNIKNTDNLDEWDITNYRYISKKACTLLVSARISLAGSTGNRYIFAVYKNGTQYSRLFDFSPGGPFTPLLSGNAIIPVVIGDTIEVFVYSNMALDTVSTSPVLDIKRLL